MDTLAFNPELGHITTFGGHPLSCAAALAGLDIMIQPGLIQQAEGKGRLIEELLDPALQSGSISDIRRKGLALGIDLADPSKRKAFLDAALKQGVVTDFYLFKPAAFRIAPPLLISEKEIREGMRRLIEAMASL
jgi:acetylornithine/succinyldiaminopimelate/putrescine aminotransferase